MEQGSGVCPRGAVSLRLPRKRGKRKTISVKELNEDLNVIGVALGRIPSGCSILTAQHAGRSSGVLVSWVQQAAFTPPSVTVGLKRDRPIAALINDAQRFLLNVIGEDGVTMLQHFGKGFPPEEDAFAGLEVEATDFGPLLKACSAFLGCRVRQVVPIGDHDLYVAEVVAAEADHETKPYVHLRKSGRSY